jgi:hypothetical protein
MARLSFLGNKAFAILPTIERKGALTESQDEVRFGHECGEVEVHEGLCAPALE